MSTHAIWWMTLGIGLLVAVIAVVLLQLFYQRVRRIEAAVADIWGMGKQVARNTATTWMLQQTTVRLDDLTEEALRHDAFLDGALAGDKVGAGSSSPQEPPTQAPTGLT